mmetsp:Transcript_31255/g.96577  ORF Transcript_31255/g.96577 Transcript_31255/m.96577 type:complete len:261 (+) Transcript_31255:575-1357(+)
MGCSRRSGPSSSPALSSSPPHEATRRANAARDAWEATVGDATLAPMAATPAATVVARAARSLRPVASATASALVRGVAASRRASARGTWDRSAGTVREPAERERPKAFESDAVVAMGGTADVDVGTLALGGGGAGVSGTSADADDVTTGPSVGAASVVVRVRERGAAVEAFGAAVVTIGAGVSGGRLIPAHPCASDAAGAPRAVRTSWATTSAALDAITAASTDAHAGAPGFTLASPPVSASRGGIGAGAGISSGSGGGD